MKWILVLLFTTGVEETPIHAEYYGTYDRMDICFEKRDEWVEYIGRPLINYQLVCVANDTENTTYSIH
jgi:hypothetical protein